MSKIGIMITMFKWILKNKTIWGYIQETVLNQETVTWKSGDSKAKDAKSEIMSKIKADGSTVAGWMVNLGIELAVANLNLGKKS